MQVTITGTLLRINEKKQTKKGFVWPFVLQQPNESTRAQCFLISAFSDANGNDPYHLFDHEGSRVEAKCYLNGNEYQGKNGTAYINELKLISLKPV